MSKRDDKGRNDDDGKNKEKEEFIKLHGKAMDICKRAIDHCHGKMKQPENLTTEELRKLMFCVREAWWLSTSQFNLDDIMDGNEFYNPSEDEDDDDGFDLEDFEEHNKSDDEDDGPPHPLK